MMTAGTEVEVARDDAWSLWDKKLIQTAAARHGRISPEELAKICGGTPAGAFKRLKEIVASRDLLSQVETSALITEDMLRLKQYLFDMVEGGEWVSDNGKVYGSGDPRWAAELLKVLKEMARQQEVSLERVDVTRAQIRNRHADLLVAALDKSLSMLFDVLETDHPEIDFEKYRIAVGTEILPAATENINIARNMDEADANLDYAEGAAA